MSTAAPPLATIFPLFELIRKIRTSLSDLISEVSFDGSWRLVRKSSPFSNWLNLIWILGELRRHGSSFRTSQIFYIVSGCWIISNAFVIWSWLCTVLAQIFICSGRKIIFRLFSNVVGHVNFAFIDEHLHKPHRDRTATNSRFEVACFWGTEFLQLPPEFFSDFKRDHWEALI